MNPYSSIIEHMEKHGSKHNPSQMQIAVVSGLEPLSIKINDANAISDNVFVNASLNLNIDIASIQTEETSLKDVLQSIYNTFKLSLNDKVLVQQVDNKFFVLCKIT